jgi:hypothetical protein
MNTLNLYPKISALSFTLFAALCSHAQAGASTAETHAFQIKAEVTYRCFGGIPPKLRDSRTQVACDNKDYNKVLFNERVNLQIKQEPTPDNTPSLIGDLTRTVPFQGRQFTLALSLFKDIAPGKAAVYHLRTVAQDDEPNNHRQSAVSTRSSTVKSLNPLQFEYNSVGQPEEIHYTVTVEPAR